MHSLGFPKLKFGPLSAFCISSWSTTSDVVGGPCLQPHCPPTLLEFSIELSFVHIPVLIMHLLPSANSCWPQAELACLWDSWDTKYKGTEIGFADLTGSCSTEEFKVLKETKKGGMLRLLIQFLWLLLVVSHLGEALTCYSCGPHSDQVISWHFQRAS